MSELSEFFLNADSDVAEIETLQIIDPDFSQTWNIVRNATEGFQATLEDASVVNFQYYPLQISAMGSGDDLDQVLEIQLGDLGDIIQMELENKRQAGSFDVRPTVIYRTFRSDTPGQVLYGPIYLELTKLTYKKEGAAIQAQAPRLNSSSTGVIYDTNTFPTLRGFV